MAGLKTPVSVIWQVVKARMEGMGLNAAARTFAKAKNTILAWERKFHDLHQVLFLYALVHEFLALVIEGDEASTKVQKNVPPDQSSGWTILLGSSQSVHLGVRLWQERAQTFSQGDHVLGQDRTPDP